MLNQIKRFMLDDSGLETVEWAIVGGVIVAAAAGFFVTIGEDVSTPITNLDTIPGNAATASAGAATGG
jgi:Flp pilus assembly pilin Flp